MKTRADDPAHPIVIPGHTYADGSNQAPEVENPGLTKREAIAIKVLTGMWANPRMLKKMEILEGTGGDIDEWIATRAAEIADALIKALNKPKEQ